MKLSDYAKNLGISYRSAWNHYKNGKIEGAYQLHSGTIIVPDIDDTKYLYPNQAVLYARVSSNQQKDDLERQADRLYQYAIANGYKVYKTIKETGSGLNDNRQKLNNIIKDKNYNKIIVEHKDRLTRFGYNYIEMIFDEQNRKIEIINQNEEKDDLMHDLISIITSFCARIYGQRRCKRKTESIIKELKKCQK